ncbi:hypothetical protein LO762_06870 [Actinocorallia sp. API 0066]|uniref:hypothetical protein n=1 Tax=Actinocorallia sp. API 0066 TaxID=2896846 RepID=UPI001E52EFC3|nr:hypothetical protein [Actinocorallia sp. API 0066]MCD0448912.1 hypothetical protein [Actinocorallia sp. API 0066]
MTDTPEPGQGRPSGVLLASIERRAKDGFTGTLRAEGPLSGEVVLAGGRVVAAATPGAPGVEPLLLRSGRVSDEAWSAAFAEGAPHGRLAEALVRRGVLGAVDVEVLALTALADAVFALALRGVHTCTVMPAKPDAPGPPLPADPGLDGERLIKETTRRLGAAARWQELGLTASVFLVRTSNGLPSDPLLAAVNGRRTARDLAFALGRGLFATMWSLTDLMEAGAVTTAESASEPSAHVVLETPDGLPKRLRGASDIVRVLPFRPDR